MVPIHRHPKKDESFVILRGKVRVTTHGDDGAIIEDVGLSVRVGIMGWTFLRVCGIWWRRWSAKTYLYPYYSNPDNFKFLLPTSSIEFERLWLGTYPDKKDIERRPLTKFMQDIWKQAMGE